MINVFNPAISLLNRLKYPQKFALISLLLVLPLALVMVLLLSEINTRVDFARKEQYGNAYLRPLRKLLEDVPQEQRLMYRFLNGDAALKDEINRLQAEIDQDLAELDTVEQQYGTYLQTADQYHALKTQRTKLKENAFTLEPEVSVGQYTTLIRSIRGLIRHVGDRSNLILDPDLDTYYLMDAVLIKLPESQDLIAQTLLLGDQIAAENTFSPDDKAQLTVSAGLIRASLNDQTKGMQIALNNSHNDQLNTALMPAFQGWVEKTNAFLRSMDVAVSNGMLRQHTIHTRTGTAALETSFQLWDSASVELEHLLQARINNFNQRWYVVSTFAAFTLAVVLYLLVAFYLAVMRTVAGLEVAAQQLVSGNTTDMVTLNTRDELGQVATSFNTVAKALLDASAQRQAIVTHAVDGILTLDAQTIITSFNPAAERLFGYSVAQAIGQRVTQLMPDFSFKPQHENKRSYETYARRRDGTTFPVELALGVMSLGKQQMVIGTVRDITERKQAEVERAEMQAAIIKAQAAALVELATPLIPLSDHVVAMPLIGAIDTQRAAQVLEALLHGIEQHKARVAILDITGVPIVDTQVAHALIQAAQAAQLLGARTILTGIRPEVAQTLATLGVDLRSILTLGTLQSGIAYAFMHEARSHAQHHLKPDDYS
jgi:PAS domain S-box-containing protein